MSGWEAYTDVLLQSCDAAAICGLTDGSVWANNGLPNLSSQELKSMSAGFTDAGALRQSGLYVNGDKYFATQCTEDALMGKKGGASVCIYKSGMAMVICVIKPESNFSFEAASIGAGNMADDLKSKGY